MSLQNIVRRVLSLNPAQMQENAQDNITQEIRNEPEMINYELFFHKRGERENKTGRKRNVILASALRQDTFPVKDIFIFDTVLNPFPYIRVPHGAQVSEFRFVLYNDVYTPISYQRKSEKPYSYDFRKLSDESYDYYLFEKMRYPLCKQQIAVRIHFSINNKEVFVEIPPVCVVSVVKRKQSVLEDSATSSENEEQLTNKKKLRKDTSQTLPRRSERIVNNDSDSEGHSNATQNNTTTPSYVSSTSPIFTMCLKKCVHIPDSEFEIYESVRRTIREEKQKVMRQAITNLAKTLKPDVHEQVNRNIDEILNHVYTRLPLAYAHLKGKTDSKEAIGQLCDVLLKYEDM